METQEQTQARLKAILGQLGSGMWLSINHRCMIAAFGQDAQLNAQAFAEKNQCAFLYKTGAQYGGGVGIFGRAYSKREIDA